ncbi:MAG: S-adenosylmethionine:tRNA ribosyltransferase-isomerase, partial [Gemmatimonadota bacterium]|nr:S-adenosylmethionine:tRNA ribosyltransferase-isomerase [Gemmatimonadota bacterium]
MSDDGRTPDGSRVSDYDYELPAELVAQYPSERREGSRLLVLGADGSLHHRSTPALVDLFAPGDALVLNESAVFPARLLGQKPTGASAEVLLLRPLRREAPSAAPARSRSTVAVDPESSLPEAEAPMPSVWEALVRPGGKLKPGRSVVVGPDLSVEIVDTLESG